MTPKPSLSRVSSQWKSRVKSQRKSTQKEQNVTIGAIQHKLLNLQNSVKETQVSLNEKNIELRRLHANLIGDLSIAELAVGNVDTSLRLAAKGVKDDLTLQLRPDVASTSITALAAAVSKAGWLLARGPGQNGALLAVISRDGSSVVNASADGTASIRNPPHFVVSAGDLLDEVCMHYLRGLSTMTRDEMRLAGYPDSEPLIDVCAGVAETRP